MSAQHVRRLMAERRIGFHKLGRSVRIARVDVLAYVEECRVEPITALPAGNRALILLTRFASLPSALPSRRWRAVAA